MLTYTQSTGSSGTMRVDDDGIASVDLYLLGVNELVDQVPWSYTINGVRESWRSFRLEANVAWQKLATLYVPTTQTVTFHLGATGNVHLGGPIDFDVNVERSGEFSNPGSGTVRIKYEDVWRYAIPFVKDDGEWKRAAPWARILGKWGPTL